MDEKISVKALEDYSDDYASKVTAGFFSSNERISGPEILKLCDIQQINLFVIRELLKAWRLEAQKLRSPYFDYSAAPVAEALKKFQNLLSNHIAISPENFQPLLKKAVAQTLYLILNPYDFYSGVLTTSAENLKLEELRNEVKYIRINRTPLERLLADLEEKKLAAVSGSEAFASLDHILEEVNFTPEDVDEHLSRFSAVVPLTLENLYEKQVRAETEVPKVVSGEKAPEPAPSPPKRGPAPAKSNPQPKESGKAQIPLYDQQPGKGTTLAENFQKRRKIKDTLTINQKFMFTKMLFNGDFEIFSQAIERIDTLDSIDQALNYLQSEYPEWDLDSEEYAEFLMMVEKRFSESSI